MNPNDPLIQIFWAWIQSCIGKPERALPAAEMAVRLNPCHPGWYNYYLAHILFRLARYQEAADLLSTHGVAGPAPALHGPACGGLRAPGAHRGGAALRQHLSRVRSATVGTATRLRVQRSMSTGSWMSCTCGGPRTRNGCAKVYDVPDCRHEPLIRSCAGIYRTGEFCRSHGFEVWLLRGYGNVAFWHSSEVTFGPLAGPKQTFLAEQRSYQFYLVLILAVPNRDQHSNGQWLVLSSTSLGEILSEDVRRRCIA